MKILKITLTLLTALFLISSCSQPMQNDNTDVTESTADNASSADEEQTAPVTDGDEPGTDNKKGLIKTVQTDWAGGLFFLENGNILLLRQPTRPISSSDSLIDFILEETSYEEGRVIIYDSDVKEKIAEIPIEPFHEDSGSVSVHVQIVEDGFALINMNEKYIKLYDNNGNETKTINPPCYDSAEYIVSYDKTRIVYYYHDWETGAKRLITDSVDLNDKKEIMTFSGLNEDKIGTLLGISRLFSYKNGIIAFSGYVIDKISPKEEIATAYGRCNYEGEEIVFNKLEKLEYLNTNYLYLSQENYFVVIENYNEDPNIPSSGIVKYQKYEEDKIGELTCEETEENHFAVISDSGKYMATLINALDNPLSKIIKIYDTSGGKLLYTHNINLEKPMEVLSVKIREQERDAYVFWGESIDVIGF